MGQNSCSISASRQHRALVETLVKAGVRVRTVQPVAGLPDLALTRDTSLMTPWGLIGLRPGIAHRKVTSFGEQVPMRRPGQPRELAPVYVLLASDEASYISGATIAVTGGKPII